VFYIIAAFCCGCLFGVCLAGIFWAGGGLDE
jgi:hypothetical protein